MSSESKLIATNDIGEMVAAALGADAEHGPVYARLIAAAFEPIMIFLNDENRRGTNTAHLLYALRDLFASNAATVIVYSVIPGKERELADIYLGSLQTTLLGAIDSIVDHREGAR